MVLLQALISFLGRSMGKVLNAIFGWSVIALFGRTSSRQQTLLSGVVAMAALWPLLAAGIAIPRIAAFLVAFVPVAKSAPDSTLRIIWIGLVILIPAIVGLVFAAKAPRGADREPFVKRVLRGYPMTVGLAAAFILMFVTVPVLRVITIVKGGSDEHVPLITEGAEYDEAAAVIDRLVEANALGAPRTDPPWWMETPAKILRATGGPSVRGIMPRRLAHWRGPHLQIALYPSDILVRGAKGRAAWTHGLVAESFARGPGLQTFDPDAQEIERQIQRIWRVYENEPEAHRHSHRLLARVLEASRDLGRLDVEYEEWQVVYRNLTQLGRAIHGEPQLLQDAASAEGGIMSSKRATSEVSETRPLESASTGELLGQFFRQTSELLKKELELAKAEVGSSVKSAVTMTVGFALAGVFGLLGLGLLCASLVLALAPSLGPGTAALVIGIVMLVIAGITAAIARSKRVKNPLERTQRTLKEDVQWAKERMA